MFGDDTETVNDASRNGNGPGFCWDSGEGDDFGGIGGEGDGDWKGIEVSGVD